MVVLPDSFKIQIMRNYTQLPVLIFLFLLIFSSCSKVNNIASTETSGGQTAISNTPLESISYNNITIDSSQTFVFSVPDITQSVVDHGSVTVYATYTDQQSQEWLPLPIINSCDSRLDIVAITAGKVQIKNNLGAVVSMSFRFDIVSNP
jgi:hypothetical protein